MADLRVATPTPGLRSTVAVDLPTPSSTGRLRYSAAVLVDEDAFPTDDEAVAYANVGHEEGALVRVDRDSNNNGKVDYWEYYEGGTLDRIGYDKDGDGKVDNWDRAPAKTASATPPAAQPPVKKQPEKGTTPPSK